VRRADPRYFDWLAYVYFGLMVPFLVWRVAVTNWGVWFGPLALMADVYGFVTGSLFVLITRRVSVPEHRPAELGRYTVDALIPTCHEPLSVLEPAVLAALRVRGIRHVLVLDDADRPEVARMARRLGARYHARPTHEYTKAGNMNYGLGFTDAQLLLVLDADHIASPAFLARTVGYFDDPGVAYVQTPQAFYNTDSIMFRSGRRGRWAEQDMFYDCIQLAKNATNSSFFVGTNAVVRRAALDAIGGFATGTATEDIHTSLRLHARGWRSVYVPEALAFGLEAANLLEYYRQRRRWAAGSLGLLVRSPDSPLRSRGLTMAQRMNYLSATLAHMQGFQRVFYLAVPMLTLLTLRSPVNADFGLYSLLLAASLGLSLFITAKYSRGTFHLLHNEVNNLVSLVPQIVGARGMLRIQTRFAVSRKTTERTSGWVLRTVYYAIFAACALSCVRAAWLLLDGVNPALVGCSAFFLAISGALMASYLWFLRSYERSNDRPKYARLAPAAKYAFVMRRFARTA
jgi:cellulose synthase (UDP-forming)